MMILINYCDNRVGVLKVNIFPARTIETSIITNIQIILKSYSDHNDIPESRGGCS